MSYQNINERRAYSRALLDKGVQITPALKREIAALFGCSVTAITVDVAWLRDPLTAGGYRDTYAVNTQNSRARRLGIEGTFTKKEWQALCKQHDHLCAKCGRAYALGPDHIIPLSKGGTNWIDNIQPMCSSCNYSKYDHL